MSAKTTTRIRRDLRRRLGILAEIKGTPLRSEIEAALVRHLDLPENAEHLRAIKDVTEAAGGDAS